MTKNVSSHKQPQQNQIISIVQEAIRLGIIKPNGAFVSMAKMPFLHYFAKKKLGLVFKGPELEKLLTTYKRENDLAIRRDRAKRCASATALMQ